jgi:hypothetical protein
MSCPEILYHYCSTDSFYQIISNQSIRLSALSFSNDYMEGRLAREIIRSLSDKYYLNDYQKRSIEELMDLFENSFDSHGFCLSEYGDLLSQWRGYADDGNGIAVGFSTTYLNNLLKHQTSSRKGMLSLTQVFYSNTDHEKIVKPIFDEVSKIVIDPDFDDRFFGGLLSITPDEHISDKRNKSAKKKMQLLEAMAKLLPKMFTLKTSAFSEESEWRLLESSVLRNESFGKHSPARNQLIPFNLLKLDPVGEINPIVKVILGPKHKTPHLNVKGFLEQHGFKDVDLRDSSASYR